MWLTHSNNLVIAHDGARTVDHESNTHGVLKLLKHGVVGWTQPDPFPT
jgi:hypothetical protein